MTEAAAAEVTSSENIFIFICKVYMEMEKLHGVGQFQRSRFELERCNQHATVKSEDSYA